MLILFNKLHKGKDVQIFLAIPLLLLSVEIKKSDNITEKSQVQNSGINHSQLQSKLSVSFNNCTVRYFAGSQERHDHHLNSY